MDLGNGTSNTTFSILKKEKKQKETKRKISENFWQIQIFNCNSKELTVKYELKREKYL